MDRPTDFEAWANTQAKHDLDEVPDSGSGLGIYDRLADRLTREDA